MPAHGANHMSCGLMCGGNPVSLTSLNGPPPGAGNLGKSCRLRAAVVLQQVRPARSTSVCLLFRLRATCAALTDWGEAKLLCGQVAEHADSHCRRLRHGASICQMLLNQAERICRRDAKRA